VLAATAVLGVGLWLATQHIDWIGLRAQPFVRIAAMAGCLVAAGVVYFGTLALMGLNLRQAVKR
jgi:putative peptidoglycan lipid II flippase